MRSLVLVFALGCAIGGTITVIQVLRSESLPAPARLDLSLPSDSSCLVDLHIEGPWLAGAQFAGVSGTCGCTAVEDSSLTVDEGGAISLRIRVQTSLIGDKPVLLSGVYSKSRARIPICELHLSVDGSLRPRVRVASEATELQSGQQIEVLFDAPGSRGWGISDIERVGLAWQDGCEVFVSRAFGENLLEGEESEWATLRVSLWVLDLYGDMPDVGILIPVPGAPALSEVRIAL